MEELDTGLLLNKEDIQLHRMWFTEFVSLHGIKVIFKKPVSTKHYDRYAELHDQVVTEGEIVGCIFEEHPAERSMRKLGWNSEDQKGNPVIHVPYDLQGLERGALFIIPSGLDNSQGRVFKVLEVSNIAIYPASIACLIGPVLESEFDPQKLDHSDKDFTVLKDIDSDEEEDED